MGREEKNDLGFLMVMVGGLKIMTMRSLHDFSKALAMGHSVKWT